MMTILNKSKAYLEQNGISYLDENGKEMLITQLIDYVDSVVNWNSYPECKFKKQQGKDILETVTQGLSIILECLNGSYQCEILKFLMKCIKIFNSLCDRCKLTNYDTEKHCESLSRFIELTVMIINRFPIDTLILYEILEVFKFIDRLISKMILLVPQVNSTIFGILRYGIEYLCNSKLTN